MIQQCDVFVPPGLYPRVASNTACWAALRGRQLQHTVSFLSTLLSQLSHDPCCFSLTALYCFPLFFLHSFELFRYKLLPISLDRWVPPISGFSQATPSLNTALLKCTAIVPNEAFIMTSGQAMFRVGTFLIRTTLILANLPAQTKGYVAPASPTRCGGNLTAPSGGPITSPNYPSPYGNNENCEWLITVPAGNTILLTFQEGPYLEEGSDFFSIYDGASDSAVELHRITGRDTVINVPSTSNTMFLRFTSDKDLPQRGFKFDYISRTLNDSAQNECGGYRSGQSGEILSPNHPGSYDNNLVCTWTIVVNPRGYIRLKPKIFILERSRDYLRVYDGDLGFNGILLGSYTGMISSTSSPGVIYSPNYPAPYGNDMNCTWGIANSQEGMGIKMTIAEFSLEERRDKLSIYAGDHVSHNALLGEYSGKDIPEEVISTAKTIHLVLTTDGSIKEDGFKIHFEVEWIHHLLEEAGSFHSNNYPHSYRNNLYQEWSISIDVGKHIRLMFTYFDVQVTEGCTSDYMIIEDPLSLDEMHHCGTCIPTPYISVGHTLHVFFVTDFAIYRTGFSAKYETVQDRSGVGTGYRRKTVAEDGYFTVNTTSNRTGWEVVGTEQFLYISVGRVGVWAVSDDSTVMYRKGTFRGAGTAGITSDNPEGTSWDSVPTANMKEVSVSSRTGQLWAVEIGGRVWRSPFYCEISVKSNWEAIEGCFSSVSVGRSGVWAVDFEGEVYHRAGTFLNETAPEKRLCAEDEVICPYSDKCIKECRVCDGTVDCGDDDDTDERNCWFANCPEKHRRVCAGEVGCYSPTRVCDGERNCGEITEDERDCPDSCVHHWKRNYLLQRDEIQCRDLSGCVRITKVCDGQKDCADGSDEINCYDFCSLHGTFGDAAYWKCRDSPSCVKGEFLCNGISDCADESDEENCDYCGLHEMTGFSKWDREIFKEGTDMLYLLHESCIPFDKVCDGYDDWYFQDEISCAQGIPTVHLCERCPHFENTCLPLGDDSYCDTIIQCDNGEDEDNCDDKCEQSGQPGWTCKCDQITGCYKPDDICDGRKQCHSLAGNDCHDDEQHCEEYCRTFGGFDCGPPWHQCISLHRVCDEHPDCNYMDNATMEFYGPTDEQNCGTCDGYWVALEEYKEKRKEEGLTTSDEYNYKCNSGKCAATFNLCDDRDFCGNWEDEQDCDITTCMDTAVRLGVSDQYKEIEVAQNCDGKDDCRTGVDENPRRCGIGACLLPVDLLVKDYAVTEGFGARHLNHGSRGLSLTEWVVDNLEDWLQITLEHPVQLAAVVVSGPRSSHPPPFTLKYGLGTDCLTTYMEAGEIKAWRTPANSAEHYLAIAVHTRVVMLTPQSALDKTVLNVGLLGCPIKEQRFNDKFCGKGWTMFEESCYQMISSPLVWWAAERYCQALGGYLAAVNTPRENEFLRNNIGNGWIGLKLDAVVMKKQRKRIKDLTWSNGSPAGDAFKEENIALDAFQEYLWRLNDPFCVILEVQGPWSLHPCSLLEKEFICEKVCDDCMARETNCGNIRCGLPDDYRCGLIYSPGYPAAFPPSAICLGDDTKNTTQCVDGDLAETQKGDLDANIPDMTVCDDCMARETSCGNIRCGLPDDYRCGLIYSPGYPAAFPPSAICLWTIDGPKGSFVTLLLLDVDLPGYSSGVCTSRVLQVRDRFLTVGWNTIHGLCRGEDEQKVYVSSSNDMQLAMLATSNSADIGGSRGFIATFNISTFSPSRQVHNLPDDARFYDVYRNRTFVWTDGIPVTYTDWSQMDLRTGFPQPDGAKINYCVAIVMKNVRETDQWYDEACDDRDTRSFICKRAAERVTRQGNSAYKL
ncbi:PREDICTED: LOW QUALITY PROTEIN: uncharacterized protein LOC109476447 [Branchiostoma belcheri]|uniref:LOW QUALITY PROTEIN: uncharacterized protein LOC109476447 n=1 Tax=Branchiostoma belcheri TaxID=7741 RepID=A0A6P4Z8E0_BRABE|nr:PREDICTED: LOW QUALITY PROTEIN: uncharacterized protein LOC109476447 [Branchiostoma belcheri]